MLSFSLLLTPHRFRRLNMQQKMEEQNCLQKMKDQNPNLVYIKSSSPYCQPHCSKGKESEFYRIPLKQVLESSLFSNFLRIHRCYCVYVPAVKRIQRNSPSSYRLYLKNGESIPVGRTFVRNLKRSGLSNLFSKANSN